MTPKEQLAAAESQIRLANAVSPVLNLVLESGMLQRDLILTRDELFRTQQELENTKKELVKAQEKPTGYVVQLASGGPAMSVVEVDDKNRAICWWIEENGQLTKKKFATDTVKIALRHDNSNKPEGQTLAEVLKKSKPKPKLSVVDKEDDGKPPPMPDGEPADPTE
jgi:uncharacterized protein YodC (DUF2158 family)